MNLIVILMLKVIYFKKIFCVLACLGTIAIDTMRTRQRKRAMHKKSVL